MCDFPTYTSPYMAIFNFFVHIPESKVSTSHSIDQIAAFVASSRSGNSTLFSTGTIIV